MIVRTDIGFFEQLVIYFIARPYRRGYGTHPKKRGRSRPRFCSFVDPGGQFMMLAISPWARPLFLHHCEAQTESYLSLLF
jgi:hypothetical protein